MKKSKGFSLITTIMVLLVMLVIGGAAAFITYYSMQATRSYAKFTVASQAASSGLYQAIGNGTCPNGIYNNIQPFTLNNVSITPSVYGFQDSSNTNCMIISQANYNGATVYKTAVIPIVNYSSLVLTGGSINVSSNSSVSSCQDSCHVPGLLYTPKTQNNNGVNTGNLSLGAQNNCSYPQPANLSNQISGYPQAQTINLQDSALSLLYYGWSNNGIPTYMQNLVNSLAPKTSSCSLPASGNGYQCSNSDSNGYLHQDTLYCSKGGSTVAFNVNNCNGQLNLGSAQLTINNDFQMPPNSYLQAGNITINQNGYNNYISFGQNSVINTSNNINITQIGGNEELEFNNSIVYASQDINLNSNAGGGYVYMDGGLFYANQNLISNMTPANSLPSNYNGGFNITNNYPPNMTGQNNNIVTIYMSPHVVNNMNGQSSFGGLVIGNNVETNLNGPSVSFQGSILSNQGPQNILNGAQFQFSSGQIQQATQLFSYTNMFKPYNCGPIIYNQLILTAQTLY